MLSAALIVVLGTATVTDLRFRRIPNWLTFGAALLGLLANTAALGIGGARLSLVGWGLGVALLIVPFTLRGLGGGDVKLLAAVGALKGPAFVFSSFLYGALVGGLIALGLLIWHRRLGATIRGLVTLQPLPTLRQRGQSVRFAYGVAIAAGTAMALALGAV
ncbi:MAG: prepilin peptidase [Chloroflexi bacterium]|nr:prepilin peptidase [Chloroflexota bacterium]